MLDKFNIKPDPDFSRILKVIANDGEPDRVPFFELFSNMDEEALNALYTAAVHEVALDPTIVLIVKLKMVI